MLLHFCAVVLQIHMLFTRSHATIGPPLAYESECCLAADVTRFYIPWLSSTSADVQHTQCLRYMFQADSTAKTSSMARPVKVEYVCINNHSLVTSLIYCSLIIHSQMMEFFGDNFLMGMGAVFVHKHLLYERSRYFKDLIDKKEIEDYNKTPKDDDEDDNEYDNHHLVVELLGLGHRACIKLRRWIYGQPMLDPQKPDKWDLRDLAEIHHISCIEGEDSSSRDTECMEACFDAMRAILSGREVDNPIKMIEGVLEDTDRPRSAVMLKQLVYSTYAADGRTKTWLDEYYEDKDDEAEIVELIYLKFAKKASGQSDCDAFVESADRTSSICGSWGQAQEDSGGDITYRFEATASWDFDERLSSRQRRRHSLRPIHECRDELHIGNPVSENTRSPVKEFNLHSPGGWTM
jgi:hypothetical protein